MGVRAKFIVQSVTKTVEGSQVRLLPVTSGSEENKEFYKWTPGGDINLSTVNPKAEEAFEPGKSFYVDFTPAE